MADNKLVALIAAGALLGAGAAVGGVFIGKGMENFRVGDRGVTVRGLSERDVKSNLAVLPLRFAVAGNVLSEVQAQIDRDLGSVRQFLTAQGYTPAEIELGRLEVVDQYAKEYQQQGVASRYLLAQTVVVRTANVDRVQATTRQLNDLVRAGVVLQDYRGPTYLFTKINDVRAAMIGEATASARTGAQQFAKDSGSSLSGIRSATQGSFEILGRDSVGDENAQVFKKLRVVTTVNYRLK